MALKINISTYQQSKLIDRELERFKSYANSKNEDVELFFTKCKQEEAFSKLQYGTSSVMVMPLDEVPLHLPEGITIAALSERMDIREVVVIDADMEQSDLDFSIQKNAHVSVSNERQLQQLSHLRPDLTIDLNVANAQVYMSHSYADIPNDKVVIALNPKEFLPEPGFGTIAWLTLTENIELRKFLKEFHQKEAAVLTNIERKVAKLNEHPDLKILGIYAYKSKDDHIHLFASGLYQGQLITSRISQTTTASISENLLDQLTSIKTHS